jgi:hypothetical protein
MSIARSVPVLAALAAAAATVPAAQAAPATAPNACAVLTKSIAATLIKEQPKTILSAPLVCNYGRVSERAATAKTVLSFSIVRNPSAAAAQAALRRIEKIVPTKTPPGMTGFKRERFGSSGGDVVYAYFKQAHGPLTGGLVFVRVGPYLAQLTPEVYSTRPSFTAADLRRAATKMAANLS